MAHKNNRFVKSLVYSTVNLIAFKKTLFDIAEQKILLRDH